MEGRDRKIRNSRPPEATLRDLRLAWAIYDLGMGDTALDMCGAPVGKVHNGVPPPMSFAELAFYLEFLSNSDIILTF